MSFLALPSPLRVFCYIRALWVFHSLERVRHFDLAEVFLLTNFLSFDSSIFLLAFCSESHVRKQYMFIDFTLSKVSDISLFWTAGPSCGNK